MPRLASSKVIDQITANLVAAATTAGARVYPDRFWPLTEADLPAIRVIAEEELVEVQSINLPMRQRHELLVNVDGYVRAVSAADEAMNDLGFQILDGLFSTNTLATLSPLESCSMKLTGMRRGVGEGAEAAMARITVQLAVQFFTSSNEPQNLAG